MEKNNGISDSRYKSRFFKKLAAWMGKHGAVLTAVVLIAVSAILGCAEATIIYAAKDNMASNDYGTRGNTSSPSYIGGGGNNPTVYEPGVIGVSVVTYDLNEVNKKGTLKYGADRKGKSADAAPVASTNDPEVVKKAKDAYADSGKAPKDQPDYYPYWIDKMGTTDKGKTIYKYSNSLHHAITSNILAMQNSYEYDDSTLVFVPRVVASSSHHSWLKNEKQSVVTGRAKGNKKSVFYDLDPIPFHASVQSPLLTETMGKEEEEKERDSTAKNSCRSVKEAPPQLTFCGVGAGRLRFTCAI